MVKKQTELAVLVVKENAADCRVLESNKKIMLRLSSTQLFELVPGMVATVDVKKEWQFGTKDYVSGSLIDKRIDIPAFKLSPLGLKHFGDWDPKEEFEMGLDTIYGLLEESEQYRKAATDKETRPSYEMEQVVPGHTDLDQDGPILDAIYYKDIGRIGEGQDILMDALAADLRCLDAHAHLGNFLFDSWPKKALLHYEVGINIGKLSLPQNFNGVLLWALIDNRPFLRCMHGYGLCLWKLGRFGAAQEVFEDLLWLNPPDNQGARFSICQIRDQEPWSEDY